MRYIITVIHQIINETNNNKLLAWPVSPDKALTTVYLISSFCTLDLRLFIIHKYSTFLCHNFLSLHPLIKIWPRQSSDIAATEVMSEFETF